MLGGLFGSSSNSNKNSQGNTAHAAAQSARQESAVGAGATLQGTIIAEGNVRIAGRMDGDVTSSASVVIHEGGQVEGNLLCDTAVIAGTVQGNVTARRVAVRATGRVLGDLHLEKLASDEGGFVKGLVTMEESVDIPALIASITGKPSAVADAHEAARDIEEPAGEAEPVPEVETEKKPASRGRKRS